jgi:hypothetical protein
MSMEVNGVEVDLSTLSRFEPKNVNMACVGTIEVYGNMDFVGAICDISYGQYHC